MVKWRSELNEIEEAVVNKKMKVVFEKSEDLPNSCHKTQW